MGGLGFSLREVRATEGSEQSGASFSPQPTLCPGHVPYFPFPVIVICLCGCLFSFVSVSRQTAREEKATPRTQRTQKGEAAPAPTRGLQGPWCQSQAISFRDDFSPLRPWLGCHSAPSLVRCLDPHPPQSWYLHLNLGTLLPSEARDVETMAKAGGKERQ